MSRLKILLTLALFALIAFAPAGCDDKDDDPPPPDPTHPVIASIDPVEGPTAGGILVTIYGERFSVSGVTTVDFGSTAATSVLVKSSGVLTCILPAGSAGAVNVTVTSPSTETGVLAAGFTYAADPVKTDVAYSLQQVDSTGCGLPSAMVMAMDPTLSNLLFVIDEAEVTAGAANGANVIALDMDTAPLGPDPAYTAFKLRKTDLLQSDGSTAVLDGDTWGGGAWPLEARTSGLVVVSSTLGFCTVASAEENNAPFLANLVAFNPATGALRQVVNLAVPYTPAPSSVRSDTSAITGSFSQTEPSGLAYVPGSGTAGKLYVSMSNLYDASGFPMTVVYNPGTVQIFSVDTSSATSPVTAPAAAVVQPSKWNPVHLTPYNSPSGKTYILVTDAGVTSYYGTTASFGYSPPYQYVSHTDAAVEIIDTGTDNLLSWDPGSGVRTTIDLGLAAPSQGAIAVTSDGASHTVGLLGSTFYGRLYAVELTGLDTAVVDGTKLRALRSAYNPIPVFSNNGTNHDYAASVSISPDGNYAFAAEFNGAKIHTVSLPANWETGTFTAHPPYFEAPFSFSAIDGGLPQISSVLFRTGTFTGAEAYVLVSNIDLDWPADNENFGSIATIDTLGRVK